MAQRVVRPGKASRWMVQATVHTVFCGFFFISDVNYSVCSLLHVFKLGPRSYNKIDELKKLWLERESIIKTFEGLQAP
jgi:hypothetical protein